MKTLSNDSFGLVPVVVQDIDTKDVLMVAYVNDEALEISKRDKLATFWSRSRNEIWQKGATSGNFLEIIDIKADCDDDTILFLVRPKGPACHRGTRTCFDDQKTKKPHGQQDPHSS